MFYKTFITACLLLASTFIAFSQTNKADSLAMYHPETNLWYPHSTPYYLYKGATTSQSQVVWSTSYHTASPVPIGSVGPQKYTRQLKGIIPNTKVGEVMKQAINDKINVILVIGDGMGSVHMTLPVYMRLANGEKKLTMFERIMQEGDCGYILTNPANGLVTGSAAAGTALATGTKTRMDMVGVDTLGMPLESALDVATARGMKTALVTDAAVTDATPAAFYGHSIDRGRQAEIARQLVEDNNIDIVMGGGASNFIPSNMQFKDIEGFENAGFAQSVSSRNDDKNLIENLLEKDYVVIHNKAQLSELKPRQKIVGLFSNGGLPARIDRSMNNDYIPTVYEMSEKTLDLMKDDKQGYFVMIECARIDWEAHANDIGSVYKAVVEMDEVLANAYKVYQASPKKTLLIFGADHETGGLGIAYRKVKSEDKESYELPNGERWETITKALSFDNFKKLAQHDMSLANIFSISKTAEELRQNIAKHTAYTITQYQAQKIFEATNNGKDIPKYKKN